MCNNNENVNYFLITETDHSFRININLHITPTKIVWLRTIKQTKPTKVQNDANKCHHFCKSNSFMSPWYRHRTVKIQVGFYLNIELYMLSLVLQFDCTLFSSGPFFNYFHPQNLFIGPFRPRLCHVDEKIGVRYETNAASGNVSPQLRLECGCKWDCRP